MNAVREPLGPTPQPSINEMGHDPCRVIVAFPPGVLESRTVIVLGCSPAETTGIAGCVHELGIRMVEPSRYNDSDNMEDAEISQVRLEVDLNSNRPRFPELHRRLATIIKKRNAAYKNWGWKDPSAEHYLEGVIQHCQNPLVVFVSKNLFDLAMFHFTFGNPSFENALEQSLLSLQRYWTLVSKLGLPTLFVSHERSLSEPEKCVEMLASFLGICPSTEQTKAAVSRIRPL